MDKQTRSLRNELIYSDEDGCFDILKEIHTAETTIAKWRTAIRMLSLYEKLTVKDNAAVIAVWSFLCARFPWNLAPVNVAPFTAVLRDAITSKNVLVRQFICDLVLIDNATLGIGNDLLPIEFKHAVVCESLMLR